MGGLEDKPGEAFVHKTTAQAGSLQPPVRCACGGWVLDSQDAPSPRSCSPAGAGLLGGGGAWPVLPAQDDGAADSGLRRVRDSGQARGLEIISRVSFLVTQYPLP